MRFILVAATDSTIQEKWEKVFSSHKDIRFVHAKNASTISLKISKQVFAAIIIHGKIEGSIPLEVYSSIRTEKNSKTVPIAWLNLSNEEVAESPYINKDKLIFFYEQGIKQPLKEVLEILDGNFPDLNPLLLKPQKKEKADPAIKEKPFKIGSGFINPFTVATVKTLVKFFAPKTHKSYVPYPRVEGENLNIAISGVLEFDCSYFKGRVGLTMTEETFQELCNRLNDGEKSDRIDKSNQDKILYITQQVSDMIFPALKKKIPDIEMKKAFIVRGDEHEVSGMDEAKALISPIDIDHLRVYIQYALIPKEIDAEAA